MSRRVIIIWVAVVFVVAGGGWAVMDLHKTDLYVVGDPPKGVATIHAPDPALLDKLEECGNMATDPAAKNATDLGIQLVNEIAARISADHSDPAIMDSDARLAMLNDALSANNKTVEEQTARETACQRDYSTMVSKSNFAVAEFSTRSACAGAQKRYAVTFPRQRWFCDVPPIEVAAKAR